MCFDWCFLRDHPGGENIPSLIGREKETKMMLVWCRSGRWSGTGANEQKGQTWTNVDTH